MDCLEANSNNPIIFFVSFKVPFKPLIYETLTLNIYEAINAHSSAAEAGANLVERGWAF